MNILYCGDKNISDGLLISVLSLLEHTQKSLNIYIITMSYKDMQKTYEAIDESFVKHLDTYIKGRRPGSSVTIFDLSTEFIKEPPTKNLDTRFTPCCMLRLYADKIPSLPKKILYLDNDVICRREFDEFYDQDIDKYQIIGSLDYFGKWFYKNSPFKFDYLNSGVLLLNMEQIRATSLFAKCRRYLSVNKRLLPDQAALNKFAEHKKIVPRRYNEQRILKNDTVFQHFTTSFRFFPYFHKLTVKPWDIDKMHNVLKLHEYDSLLEKYLELKSEFAREYEEKVN